MAIQYIVCKFLVKFRYCLKFANNREMDKRCNLRVYVQVQTCCKMHQNDAQRKTPLYALCIN